MIVHLGLSISTVYCSTTLRAYTCSTAANMPSHRTCLHITSKTSRPSREIYREENLAVRSPLLARRHGLGGAAAAPRLAIFFILPPKKGPAERPPTTPANSEHGRNLKPAIVSSHQSSRKGAPRFRVMLPRVRIGMVFPVRQEFTIAVADRRGFGARRADQDHPIVGPRH